MIVSFEDSGTFQLCSQVSQECIKNVILHKSIYTIFLEYQVWIHRLDLDVQWAVVLEETHTQSPKKLHGFMYML